MTCLDYECDQGLTTITLRPAKTNGSLPLGLYTWTVTTDAGELFEGSCMIDGVDSQCDGGAILSFRDGEVIGWQLTLSDDSVEAAMEPASASVEIVHEGETLYANDAYVFDYEPRDECHLDCLDARLALEV